MVASIRLLSCTCFPDTKRIVPTEYVITMPNMYARGILFGKMVLELGDTCIAKNEKNDLYCDLDFKTKVVTSSNIGIYLLTRDAPRVSFREHTTLCLAG